MVLIKDKIKKAIQPLPPLSRKGIKRDEVHGRNL